MGVTGTAYTDIGLANGTTYYYFVTASNGAESGIERIVRHAEPGQARRTNAPDSDCRRMR